MTEIKNKNDCLQATSIILCLTLVLSFASLAQEASTTPELRMVVPDESAEDPFAAVLDPLMTGNLIPGYYFAVHRQGEKIYESSQGYADIETGLTPNENVVYFLASMTKPIVTAAILKLVDEGKISLDQNLSDFIPAFKNMMVLPFGSYDNQILPANREITIRHLLTHTSGLAYAFGGNTALAKTYDDLGVMTIGSLLSSELGTLDNHVENLLELPLFGHPGEQMLYSVSIDVLGKVIEIITGESLAVYLQDSIFKPLGMSNATYWTNPEKSDNLARLYAPISKTDSQCLECPKFVKSPLITGTKKNFTQVYDKSKRWDSGGAGAAMSAKDWNNFISMLLSDGIHRGKQFLSKKSVKLMTTHQLPGELGSDALVNAGMGPAAKGFGFSFGLGIVPESSGNLSEPETYDYLFWMGAANTGFWIDPKKNLSGIFLTQLYPMRYPSIFQLQEAADKVFGSTN